METTTSSFCSILNEVNGVFVAYSAPFGAL